MSASITREDGDALLFAATTRLAVGRSVAVTSHPVESGADVSDHAQPDAETIQIGGIIALDTGPNGRTRALAFLDGICVGGEVVTVEHPRIGRREGMVCEGYTCGVPGMTALEFSASFRQVRIVLPFVVEIPPGQPTARGRDLAGETDAGQQATAEAAPAQAQRVRSIAASLIDVFGGG